MNMIKGLIHTHLVVPEDQLDNAKRFYCDVLGLDEIEKNEMITYFEGKGFWVRAGSDHIYVREALHSRELFGMNSLVYEVVNIDDTRTRLKAYGMTTYNCSYEDYERMICYDPFGNQLQFIMKKYKVNYQLML